MLNIRYLSLPHFISQATDNERFTIQFNFIFTSDIAVPAKSIIIHEGGFTDKLFLIKKGCVKG